MVVRELDRTGDTVVYDVDRETASDELIAEIDGYLAQKRATGSLAYTLDDQRHGRQVVSVKEAEGDIIVTLPLMGG